MDNNNAPVVKFVCSMFGVPFPFLKTSDMFFKKKTMSRLLLLLLLLLLFFTLSTRCESYLLRISQIQKRKIFFNDHHRNHKSEEEVFAVVESRTTRGFDPLA